MTWTHLQRADLQCPKTRARLKSRTNPYWSLLSYGRHLGLHKRARGKAYWVARYRTKSGWYSQHRLAAASENPKIGVGYDQARSLAWEWFASPTIASKIGDTWPIGQRQQINFCPIGSVYTIAHALVDFIEWKQLAAAESYIHTLVTLANCHIIPRVGTMAADDFNALHLKDFVKDVLETPATSGLARTKPKVAICSLSEDALRKRKKTVNTLIGVLRMSLRMAWESGKIENSRAWHVLRRVPNVDVPRTLHLSRDECQRLLDCCSPELRRLVLGALYTGCRCTELLRMEAVHVGRDGYGVYVTPVKRYRARFVFLPDEGMRFFLELAHGKRPNDPLFMRDNGRPWFANYKAQYKRAVVEAGLPKAFTFHGLRHTYASQFVQAGTPLMVVAEQLGHANALVVSRTYGHLAPQIREAEVRQRFWPLSKKEARLARRDAHKLKAFRESLYGPDWRTYADVTAISSAMPDFTNGQRRLPR